MDCKRILLTTDFSDDARKAYAVAVSLAKKLGSEFYLAHVVDSAASFYFKSEGFGSGLTRSDFMAQLNDILNRELEHESFEAMKPTPALITEGDIVSALREFETKNEIDLTVLSSHGHSGLRYALLGSNAERITRGLTTPVLTCRNVGKAGFEPKTVLVPYDFSENAKSVLPAIRFLARTFTPEFKLVFVVEPLYPFFGETAVPASYEVLEEAIKATPSLVKSKFEELKSEELAGVNVSLDIVNGAPTVEIVEHANASKADLVVMATHGWTGFKHFFLGSVAETVVRKSPCSVLTVRTLPAK